MKSFILAALLGAQVVAGAVEYTPVYDARCHEDPNPPVVPPTPGPSPYPDPPTPHPAPYVCDGRIVGFNLIEVNTGKIIPGYANMTGYRKINLKDVPTPISLEAIDLGQASRVQFRCLACTWKNDHIQEEGARPYAMGGDKGMNSDGTYKPFKPVIDFAYVGTYVIEGIGKEGSNWESYDEACVLTLELVDGFETIQNDEYCAPEQIKLSTVGNQVYESAPVQVVSIDVNSTVFFKTTNTINGQKMDWITTSFVTPSGTEVCDKIADFEYQALSEHVYEAKCFDGFAYADIYAYSSAFSDLQAAADTYLLPDECRNDFEGKVIKYSFVFSCDCDTIPDVPDYVSGNEPHPSTCIGPGGRVFGEPHIYPFDAVGYDCNAEGEMLITKAEIADRDYDFELHGRFTRFRWHNDSNCAMPWTWIDGVVAKSDVTVQVSTAEVPDPEYSYEFDEMWVDIFVDGERKKLLEVDDHRLKVSLNDRFIIVYFTSSGIELSVEVRAWANFDDSTVDGLRGAIGSFKQGSIPGAFTVRTCFPEDNDAITNFIGMWGTPNGDINDDYKDRQGNILDVPNIDKHKYNRTDYCLENWCINDVQDSLFLFPNSGSGFDFDYYNKCDSGHKYCESPAARRKLEVAEEECVLSLEFDAKCRELDEGSYEACKTECCIGPGPCDAFLSAEKEVEAAIVIKDEGYDVVAVSETAGCSLDYKTTVKKVEGAEYDWEAKCMNQYQCDPCLGVAEGTAVWLSNGDLDGCGGLGEVPADENCCDGLEYSDSGCVVAAQRRRRHLEVARPDHPAVRNIVPLRSEL